MWDLIVSVPDHCLSFYLKNAQLSNFRIFDEKAILFYCI